VIQTRNATPLLTHAVPVTYDLVKVPTNSDEACLWRLGKASLHLVAFSFELFSRSGASDKNCRCLCEHSVQHESSVSEDRPVYVTCSFLHLHHDHAFQLSFCASVWSSFVLSLHFHIQSTVQAFVCVRWLLKHSQIPDVKQRYFLGLPLVLDFLIWSYLPISPVISHSVAALPSGPRR